MQPITRTSQPQIAGNSLSSNGKNNLQTPTHHNKHRGFQGDRVQEEPDVTNITANKQRGQPQPHNHMKKG